MIYTDGKKVSDGKLYLNGNTVDTLYYNGVKKYPEPPEFLETVNTYDFTNDGEGVIVAAREQQVDGLVTGPFPTNFEPIKTPSDGGGHEGEFNRKRFNSPSGNNIIGPQDAGNWYIYAEGSGGADNGVSLGYRFCFRMPGSFKRERDLSLTAKVSITRFVLMDVIISLYHRPVGGDNTDWVKAADGPGTLGGSSFFWQDWVAPAIIGPGEPVELMFVFRSQADTSVWTDKAFFDSGIDDIRITETEAV